MGPPLNCHYLLLQIQLPSPSQVTNNQDDKRNVGLNRKKKGEIIISTAPQLERFQLDTIRIKPRKQLKLKKKGKIERKKEKKEKKKRKKREQIDMAASADLGIKS